MMDQERITQYIHSLDQGHGAFCDQIAKAARADRVPIIRKETANFLQAMVAATPLIRGSPARSHPRRDITSAGADCRYRAPLSPRLRGSFMTCSCAHLRVLPQMPV